MALAHDVKCWNAHRKREVLQTALSFARSQHEATRRAVDAWSCLRDGYVGPTLIPSTQARRMPKVTEAIEISPSDDAEATIFSSDGDGSHEPTIVAVDHELLKFPAQPSAHAEPSVDPTTILPFAVASPIPDTEDEQEETSEHSPSGHSSQSSDSDGESTGDALNFGSSAQLGVSTESMAQSTESMVSREPNHSMARSRLKTKGDDEEVLTSSMQSLVDGLMNWGGQYDSEEDYALPTGMAASIALEESAVIGAHSKLI